MKPAPPNKRAAKMYEYCCNDIQASRTVGAQPQRKENDRQKYCREAAEPVSCLGGGGRRAGYPPDRGDRGGGDRAAQRDGGQPDG